MNNNSANLLTNRIALITGASGGLGSAVTTAMLAAGATVAGVSRSIRDSDFPGDSFFAVRGELTSAAGAETVVRQVVERAGRIDILVHLLGSFAGGAPVSETSDEVFDNMVDTNLRAAFLMLRAVLPGMRERNYGRIVAIGSRAAAEPAPGMALYAASKAAAVSLIRSVAAENSDRGITANIVLPGTLDTPATRGSMADADTGKWIDTGQLAQFLVALSSDAYPQLNGTAIPFSRQRSLTSQLSDKPWLSTE